MRQTYENQPAWLRRGQFAGRGGPHRQPAPAEKGLKDYYKAYFPIDVTVSPAALKNPAEVALIPQQFNSLTPKNDMKMGPIHPRRTATIGARPMPSWTLPRPTT